MQPRHTVCSMAQHELADDWLEWANNAAWSFGATELKSLNWGGELSR